MLVLYHNWASLGCRHAATSSSWVGLMNNILHGRDALRDCSSNTPKNRQKCKTQGLKYPLGKNIFIKVAKNVAVYNSKMDEGLSELNDQKNQMNH